jgi:hypothetical protein
LALFFKATDKVGGSLLGNPHKDEIFRIPAREQGAVP